MLAHSDMDGTLTPDTDRSVSVGGGGGLLIFTSFRPDSPPLLNIRGATSGGLKPGQGPTIKGLRVGRKDLKKGGDALRGKNVTEAFRVKDKDLKRTMK